LSNARQVYPEYEQFGPFTEANIRKYKESFASSKRAFTAAVRRLTALRARATNAADAQEIERYLDAVDFQRRQLDKQEQVWNSAAREMKQTRYSYSRILPSKLKPKWKLPSWPISPLQKINKQNLKLQFTYKQPFWSAYHADNHARMNRYGMRYKQLLKKYRQ
jgi:hypothetical protein